MILTDVEVEGFRSIENPLSIKLGAPTILVGHNDAGKSAMLDAIAFLLDEYKVVERDRTYGPIGDDGQQTRVPEAVVTGKFQLRELEAEALSLPREVSIRRVVREGGVVLESLSEVPLLAELRDPESQKVDVLRYRLETLGEDKTGLKPVLVERINKLAEAAEKIEEWVPASADLRRAMPRAFRFDATSSQNPEEAILTTLKASYSSHLGDEEIEGTVAGITKRLEELVIADAEELREHIKTKCPDIGEITIRPTVQLAGGLKGTEISARNKRDEDVPLGQSGAGRSRRIALAVWEYQARVLEESDRDVVLLYDEPDTHLDYSHQRGFMKILSDQVKLEHVKIVVATHSMNLIDGVDIANVVHLEHEDSRTRASKLADDSEVGRHLGAIAASLGLRNTVLLHERLFVGVEGETETRAFPVLFKLATGRHLESCGLAIWPCGSNDGALRFAEYLHKHGRKVLMVVDADSRDLKAFRDSNLQRFGLDPNSQLLEVGVREFEDTFTDSQWAACANREWKRHDGADWTEEHFSQHRSGKFSSAIEKMIREDGSGDLSGKPEMMTALALGLTSRDDVPADLINLFAELTRLAA